MSVHGHEYLNVALFLHDVRLLCAHHIPRRRSVRTVVHVCEVCIEHEVRAHLVPALRTCCFKAFNMSPEMSSACLPNLTVAETATSNNTVVMAAIFVVWLFWELSTSIYSHVAKAHLVSRLTRAHCPRRIDPFIGLFADPFVGGTELDGGLVPNAIFFVCKMLEAMQREDGDFKPRWMADFSVSDFSLLTEVHAALMRAMPLARAQPQVCKAVLTSLTCRAPRIWRSL